MRGVTVAIGGSAVCRVSLGSGAGFCIGGLLWTVGPQHLLRSLRLRLLKSLAARMMLARVVGTTHERRQDGCSAPPGVCSAEAEVLSSHADPIDGRRPILRGRTDRAMPAPTSRPDDLGHTGRDVARLLRSVAALIDSPRNDRRGPSIQIVSPPNLPEAAPAPLVATPRPTFDEL